MSSSIITGYINIYILNSYLQICCHIINKYNNTTFIVLISDFNKEQYELPEDDLKTDRNMLECFKCF
jgi:hypothetical protein